MAPARRFLFGRLLVAVLAGLPTLTPAQSIPASTSPSPHRTTGSAAALAQNAASLQRLTQANQDLLDLLKKQQAVLEDIQYDRRLQNRQIASLEERLEDALQENAQLQAKIAKLEEQISIGPTISPPGTLAPGVVAAPAPAPAPTAKLENPPPAPPSTYLSPAETGGAPGTKWWHRLFTLSGTDAKNTDIFHVEGRQWRVVWHNLDRPGDAYANTSALFINAFPKDDTIPQKVCSKLGTGGDATELDGPGDYYLKVEASGGSWELAVEDFK